MKKHIFTLILSLIASILIFILTKMYSAWYFYLLIIPMALAIYIIWIVLFILFLQLLSFIFKLFKVKPKPSKLFYYIIKETTFIVIHFFRIRVKIINKELEPKEKYLLISNHESNFDPIIAFRALNANPLICVTKPANLSKPFMGNWVTYSGFVPISQDNDLEAVKSITKAANILKDKSSSVIIYPEGKRYFDDGLLPFHAGSFKIATKSKAPIVISSVRNTKIIKDRFPLRGSKVEFKIIKVLYYEDYKDMNTKDLADYSRNLILEDLK